MLAAHLTYDNVFSQANLSYYHVSVRLRVLVPHRSVRSGWCRSWCWKRSGYDVQPNGTGRARAEDQRRCRTLTRYMLVHHIHLQYLPPVHGVCVRQIAEVYFGHVFAVERKNVAASRGFAAAGARSQ